MLATWRCREARLQAELETACGTLSDSQRICSAHAAAKAAAVADADAIREQLLECQAALDRAEGAVRAELEGAVPL